RDAPARPPDADRSFTARSLAQHREVYTPVPAPALLGLLLADRELLAVADRRQALGRDAEADEVIARRGRPAGAEREVVLDGAAVVAVAFDLDARGRVRAEPFGVQAQRVARFAAQRRRVVVEVDVVERTIAAAAERAAA